MSVEFGRPCPVYPRPPAWPGFNNKNLNLLAVHLWNNVSQEDFSMKPEENLFSPIEHAQALWALGAGESLTSYCSRVLIRRASFAPRWTWCFSPEWAKVDNTVKGCAQRIHQLVSIGMPLTWADQIVASAPLSYLDVTPEILPIEEGQWQGGGFEFSRVSIEERKQNKNR